jgi:hypothetical protein
VKLVKLNSYDLRLFEGIHENKNYSKAISRLESEAAAGNSRLAAGITINCIIAPK